MSSFALRPAVVSLVVLAALPTTPALDAQTPRSQQGTHEVVIGVGMTIGVPAAWERIPMETLEALNADNEARGGVTVYDFGFTLAGFVGRTQPRWPYALGQVFEYDRALTLLDIADELAAETAAVREDIEAHVESVRGTLEASIGVAVLDRRAGVVWRRTDVVLANGKQAEGLSCFFVSGRFAIVIHFYDSPTLPSDVWETLESVARSVQGS